MSFSVISHPRTWKSCNWFWIFIKLSKLFIYLRPQLSPKAMRASFLEEFLWQWRVISSDHFLSKTEAFRFQSNAGILNGGCHWIQTYSRKILIKWKHMTRFELTQVGLGSSQFTEFFSELIQGRCIKRYVDNSPRCFSSHTIRNCQIRTIDLNNKKVKLSKMESTLIPTWDRISKKSLGA